MNNRNWIVLRLLIVCWFALFVVSLDSVASLRLLCPPMKTIGESASVHAFLHGQANRDNTRRAQTQFQQASLLPRDAVAFEAVRDPQTAYARIDALLTAREVARRAALAKADDAARKKKRRKRKQDRDTEAAAIAAAEEEARDEATPSSLLVVTQSTISVDRMREVMPALYFTPVVPVRRLLLFLFLLYRDFF